MPYPKTRPQAYGANAKQPPYGGSSPGTYGGGEAAQPPPEKATPVKPYYKIAHSLIPNIPTASEADYLRFIFWGGAKSHGDNSAFYEGMKEVRNDYQESAVYDRPVFSAAAVTTNINMQNDGAIQSLDFLCHGGPLALFFVNSSLEDGTAFHSPTSMKYTFHEKYLEDNDDYNKLPGIKTIREAVKKYYPKMVQNNLYSSQTVQDFAPMFPPSGLLDARALMGNLGDIEYGKFTNSAKVEIHGCRTAERKPVLGSFCEVFSESLYEAGKERAVVIGHTTKNLPLDKDYRQGTRHCYHDGTILFAYKDFGHIPAKTINKYLDEKEAELWEDHYPEISGGKETKVPRK